MTEKPSEWIAKRYDDCTICHKISREDEIGCYVTQIVAYLDFIEEQKTNPTMD